MLQVKMGMPQIALSLLSIAVMYHDAGDCCSAGQSGQINAFLYKKHKNLKDA
jgi:hypothetical protein